MGQNNRTAHSSPVQIPGTTWSTVAQAYYCTGMATKTDGTLWVWGNSDYGVLGLNGTPPSHISSPIQIPGTNWDTTVNGIAGAEYGMLARKTDGTLWSWGDNAAGQLGQNNNVRYSSPIQIPGTWDGIDTLNGKSPIAYKNA